MKKLILYFVLVILLALLYKVCTPAIGNHTGREYMPDMAHSIAYEANADNYYYWHIWGSKDDYRKLSQPRLPVKGTIPRGMSGSDNAMNNGSASPNAISLPVNGHVNYYYGNTEEERTRASVEITKNPFPITKTGLARGKDLYNVYCGICHGEKGDGNGYLVRDDGKYPAQPANFITDDFIKASNGRYYHSIMYGRNVMGSYADKLSYEERWQVIHYIRSMQAASKNLPYDETNIVVPVSNNTVIDTAKQVNKKLNETKH